MTLRPADFKSAASANSAIPAGFEFPHHGHSRRDSTAKLFRLAGAQGIDALSHYTPSFNSNVREGIRGDVELTQRPEGQRLRGIEVAEAFGSRGTSGTVA